MAKVLYPPACDAALLSAYRDELLDTTQRRVLETHLESCPACRQELRQYEHLAVGLQRLPLVPRCRPSIAPRYRKGEQVPVGQQPPFRFPFALVGVSLAAVLVFVVFIQRVPQHPTTLFEAYPPAGASDVSTDTSIMITFQQPVDQVRIQQTLHFDPPVPFDITWDSAQRAEVIPLTPLTTSTTYTLQAVMPLSARSRVSSAPPPPATVVTPDTIPQTLTVFHTAPRSPTEGGPAPIVARTDLFGQALPASVSQAVLDVLPTPSPVSLPSAALQEAEAASPPVATVAPVTSTIRASQATARPVATRPVTVSAPPPNASILPADRATSPLPSAPPVRAPAQPTAAPVVGSLPLDTVTSCLPASALLPIYNSRGDIRAALGCAGKARATTLVVQDFQRGMLLAVFPDDVVYELTMDGTWQAMLLTTNAATMPTSGIAPSVGPTFRGYWLGHSVLASTLGAPLAPEDADQSLLQSFAHGFMLATPAWTYIADDAGQWQRVVSHLPSDGSTPSPGGGAVTGGVPSFPPLRLASRQVALPRPTVHLTPAASAPQSSSPSPPATAQRRGALTPPVATVGATPARPTTPVGKN